MSKKQKNKSSPSKRKNSIGLPASVIERYRLYELSVQSPKEHIDWLVQMYREIRGKYARHLREDFCGTFRLSAEWISRNRNNTAIGLDLDREPIEYGKKTHYKTLTASQKSRLEIIQQNVMTVSPNPVDLCIACNFSFCVFMTRRELVAYFRYVLQSLSFDGVFLLEIAGGPGMIEKQKDTRPIYADGKRVCTYIWDQQEFDPVSHKGRWAIHFGLPSGKRIENAFVYPWRLWTIPEIREALDEAGFRETVVYWETSHKGEATGEYLRSEFGDNSYSWIAYVVGLR